MFHEDALTFRVDFMNDVRIILLIDIMVLYFPGSNHPMSANYKTPFPAGPFRDKRLPTIPSPSLKPGRGKTRIYEGEGSANFMPRPYVIYK